MGVNFSKEYEYSSAEPTSFPNFKDLFSRHPIPIHVSVAHFTPSTFPILPMISLKTTMICRESWAKILAKDSTDENGVVTAGMTMFYNTFYETLEKYDGNKDFESVLTRNCKGTNKIAAKANILIKIIKYVLKIEEASPQIEAMLDQLGKRHDRMKIHPWQYATYIQTVLLTIAGRLETYATYSVMEAWVNLFAYVLKFMLPSAIKNMVSKSEFHFDCNIESVKSTNLMDKQNQVESAGCNDKDVTIPTDRTFVVNIEMINTPGNHASLKLKSDFPSSSSYLNEKSDLFENNTVLHLEGCHGLKQIKARSFKTLMHKNSFKSANSGVILNGLITPVSIGNNLEEHFISSINEEDSHDNHNILSDLNVDNESSIQSVLHYKIKPRKLSLAKAVPRSSINTIVAAVASESNHISDSVISNNPSEEGMYL
eukprot:gene1627-3150_t